MREAGSGLRTETVVLSFPEATQVLLRGGAITKLEWDNENIYGRLVDNLLYLHTNDGFVQWILSFGDMVGRDWIELE